MFARDVRQYPVGRKEGLAVPLSQLKPARDTDERTQEAIADWHYRVGMGYEL